MKKWTLLLLTISSANASIWNGNLSVQQEYACLGVDSVPIGLNSPLAGTCCTADHQLVPNPPAKCRTGFDTISVDAGNGAAGGVTIAQQSLQVSSGLGGANANGSTSTTGTSSAGSGSGAESMASWSADESGNGIGTTTSNSGTTSAANNGSSDTGSTAGSSGSALGVSATAGTQGDGNSAKGSSDPNALPSHGGGFVKGDGKTGEGLAGFGVGASAGGPQELNLSEKSGIAGAITGEDPDGKGVSEDPSDYFNRIDRSANLFQVVSARYMKKKTLWVKPKEI